MNLRKAGNENFLLANWHWLALAASLALLAFAAVFIAMAAEDAEVHSAVAGSNAGRAPDDTGIAAVSMEPFELTYKATVSPFLVIEPSNAQASFLASERRVYCEKGAPGPKAACGLPIPFGSKKCPLCGMTQPEEVKIVLDTDKDGLPDEYEKKYALNPNDAKDIDADKDGDGFTNMEEFKAGTDPSDPDSHPDYLEFVSIQAPLFDTKLQFLFERIDRTPAGDRLRFKNPKKRNNYGGLGLAYEVRDGEKIGDTGFRLKSHERKLAKVPIPGSSLTKERDVSTATVERISDGKTIVLKIGDRKFEAVDMKAKLHYSRGGGKEWTVAKGDFFQLNLGKYKTLSVSREGKRAKVEIEDEKTGKKRLFEALEH